jgi:hypothetical protein
MDKTEIQLDAYFVMEKETKNTVRFQEETEGHPLVGYLYLQKSAVQLLGLLQRIKITIEPA